MRTKHLISLICAGFVALMASGAPLGAQSLADVARAEEARRKAVRTPGKVYTNDDLKGAGNAGGAAAPVQPATSSTAKPETDKATADKAAADKLAADAAAKKADPTKEEKYWKDRITALRNQVARNKVLTDALQSRVNALSTDFVNTDDPAQRAVVEENRKTALREMERVTKDTDAANKAMFNLAEEARKANVPPGWLR